MYVYHIYLSTCGGQKWILDFLELELQVVISISINTIMSNPLSQDSRTWESQQVHSRPWSISITFESISMNTLVKEGLMGK